MVLSWLEVIIISGKNTLIIIVFSLTPTQWIILLLCFSKVIGPRPQGLWMGFLTAAGSLARICGPVFVSEIYKEFGTYWTYGLTAISLALAIAGTLLTYTRLIPMEMRLGRSNTAEDNSKL